MKATQFDRVGVDFTDGLGVHEDVGLVLEQLGKHTRRWRVRGGCLDKALYFTLSSLAAFFFLVPQDQTRVSFRDARKKPTMD